MSENPRKPADNFTAIRDFEAGAFERKISEAIREAATAAIRHNKQGKVTIELRLSPIDEHSRQLSIAHKIASLVPHQTGDRSDNSTTKSLMWVHQNGALSPWSEDQLQMPIGRKED